MPSAGSFEFESEEIEKIERSHSLAALVTAGSAVFFLTLAANFLFVVEWPQSITFEGYTDYEGGVFRILAPMPGTISEIHVAPGQLVEPELAIATLDTIRPNNLVDGGSSSEMLVQHDERVAVLEGLLALVEQNAEQEEVDLLRNINQREVEAEMLQRQIDLQQARVNLLAELIAQQSALVERGHGAEAILNQRREAHLAAQQQLVSLQIQRQEVLDEISAARHELEDVPRTSQAEIARSRLQLIDARQARLSARVDLRTIVSSPGRALVSSVHVVEGQDVSDGSLIATLVTSESELIVRLLVPTSGVGSLTRGQSVRMQFAGNNPFDEETNRGTIQWISSTAIQPNDIIAPLPVDRPFHIALVRFDGVLEPNWEEFLRSIPLHQGVRAEVNVGRVTLWERLVVRN